MKNISLEYLVEIMKKATCKVTIIVLPNTYNNTAEDFEWFYKNKGNEEKIQPLKNLVPA